MENIKKKYILIFSFLFILCCLCLINLLAESKKTNEYQILPILIAFLLALYIGNLSSSSFGWKNKRFLRYSYNIFFALGVIVSISIVMFFEDMMRIAFTYNLILLFWLVLLFLLLWIVVVLFIMIKI